MKYICLILEYGDGDQSLVKSSYESKYKQNIECIEN